MKSTMYETTPEMVALFEAHLTAVPYANLEDEGVQFDAFAAGYHAKRKHVGYEHPSGKLINLADFARQPEQVQKEWLKGQKVYL